MKKKMLKNANQENLMRLRRDGSRVEGRGLKQVYYWIKSELFQLWWWECSLLSKQNILSKKPGLPRRVLNRFRFCLITKHAKKEPTCCLNMHFLTSNIQIQKNFSQVKEFSLMGQVMFCRQIECLLFIQAVSSLPYCDLRKR